MSCSKAKFRPPCRRPRDAPFQTRCGHKRDVPDLSCERETPPTRHAADGHAIKCHLPIEALKRMEPVFS